MRMTYAPDIDALAIKLVKGRGHIETEERDGGVNLDYDADGRLVAIEVLGASRYYPRTELEQLAQPIHYLTLAEAVKESRLKPATLRAAIRAGELPVIPRGRGWLIAGAHEEAPPEQEVARSNRAGPML